jgi:hypothetical protein
MICINVKKLFSDLHLYYIINNQISYLGRASSLIFGNHEITHISYQNKMLDSTGPLFLFRLQKNSLRDPPSELKHDAQEKLNNMQETKEREDQKEKQKERRGRTALLISIIALIFGVPSLANSFGQALPRHSLAWIWQNNWRASSSGSMSKNLILRGFPGGCMGVILFNPPLDCYIIFPIVIVFEWFSLSNYHKQTNRGGGRTIGFTYPSFTC